MSGLRVEFGMVTVIAFLRLIHTGLWVPTQSFNHKQTYASWACHCVICLLYFKELPQPLPFCWSGLDNDCRWHVYRKKQFVCQTLSSTAWPYIQAWNCVTRIKGAEDFRNVYNYMWQILEKIQIDGNDKLQAFADSKLPQLCCCQCFSLWNLQESHHLHLETIKYDGPRWSCYSFESFTHRLRNKKCPSVLFLLHDHKSTI